MAKLKNAITDNAALIHVTLDQVASKWAVLVITNLCDQPQRFNAIKRRLAGVTQKALTDTLRRLEKNGLVERRVIPTSPVAVEYSLTPLGRTLQKPFLILSEWALRHHEDIDAAQKSYDKRQPK